MAKQAANADGFGKFKFELTGVGSRVAVIPEHPVLAEAARSTINAAVAGSERA